MTNLDRLFEALKLLGITTEPTDISGENAWYAPDGEYLGTFNVPAGLAYLKLVAAVADR